jgi:hypothetical protein
MASIDRHITIGLGGGEPRYFSCHLAFGYAGRRASATATVVNRGRLCNFHPLQVGRFLREL